MAAEHNLTVTARAKDELSGPMRDAAESLADMARKVASSDEQVAKSSKAVKLARDAQLSASKQVEAAIKMEMAAGKPQEQQLVRLQTEYEQLTTKMRAMVRAGQGIPEELTRSAAAAKASADQIQMSFTEAATKTQASGIKIGASIKSAPEQFAKAAAGATLLNSATGGMGGAFGQAANKATGLLSIIATGGPLGIGVAALTAAVSAGAVVWKVYREEQENVERASRAVSRALAEQAKRVEGVKQAAELAEKKLADYGKTAEQIELDDLNAAIEGNTRGLEDNARTIERLRLQQEQLNKAYAEESKRVQEARIEAARYGDGIAYVDTTKLKSLDTDRQTTAAQIKSLETVRKQVQAALEGNERRRAALEAIAARQRQASEQEKQAAEEAKRVEDERRRVLELRASAERRLADEKRKIDDEERRRASQILAVEQARAARSKAVSDSIAAYQLEQANRRDAMLIKSTNEAAEAQEKAMQEAARRQQQSMAQTEQVAQRVSGTMVNAFTMTYAKMRDQDMSFREAFGSTVKTIGAGLMQQAATYAIAEGVKRAAKQLTLSFELGADTTSAASALSAESAKVGGAVAAGSAKLGVDASTAASGALAAHAGIPFVGLAVGLAAAAAIVAAIFAAKKFAAGGEVTGGVPGRDSVPAMLMPGEYVLSVPAVQSLRRALGVPAQPGQQNFASGGYVPQRQRGGGPQTIVIRNESVIPMTSTAIKRQLLQVRRSMSELNAKGAFV